jgi:hypothetical protein
MAIKPLNMHMKNSGLGGAGIPVTNPLVNVTKT